MKTMSLILSVVLVIAAFITNTTAESPLLRASSFFLGITAAFAATSKLITGIKNGD